MRSDSANSEEAFLTGVAIGDGRALLRASGLTHAIDAGFISGAFSIRLAPKLDTLAVDARTIWTVGVHLALIWVGLTLPVDARSSVWAV